MNDFLLKKRKKKNLRPSSHAGNSQISKRNAA